MNYVGLYTIFFIINPLISEQQINTNVDIMLDLILFTNYHLIIIKSLL
jgi:hypothetical protein